MNCAKHLAAATLSLLGTLSGAAWGAAPSALSGQQVLNQFNLVTLGNATMNSHVDGRSFIGGTLNSNGAVFSMHPNDMPASDYAGLTVLGNASSGSMNVTAGGATVLGNLANANINNGAVVVGGNASNSNFNGSGGAYVAGSSSGVNRNSGNLSSTDAAAKLAIAQSTNMAAVLNQTSDQLKALASTGSSWTVNGNKVTFNAVADSNGLAVFDLSNADYLLGLGEFEFNYGSATTVVFNSDITGGTIAANFLGGSAQTIATKTLWNFYDATSLTIARQFGGSILATDAALTVNGNIEGGVFVSSLAAQTDEIHEQAFTGTLPTQVSAVPEPATWALMAGGLLLLPRLRRRA